MTPIEFMESGGILKDDVIIGHGVMLSGHNKVLHPYGDDLSILAKRKCSVSHQPTTFAMRGTLYEAYSDYLNHGINCTIGTDIPPYDIIREMRWTAILCKNVKADSYAATARDVYNSATLSGAKALKRPDLGCISVGAKTDIAIIDLKSFHMTPIRNPLKNLVYYGHTSDVDTVFVVGKKLVERGVLLGFDEEKLLDELQKRATNLFDRISKRN